MAEFSSHTPGAFSWVELATSDQRAAAGFYGTLFGWDVTEHPMGPGEVYTIFLTRGQDVAAAYTMGPEERQSGVPPHWNLYVAVADVDETVQHAQALGARVLAPPFDVTDVGRMAALEDPTGAAFMVWQAKHHIGAKILNEPGALCWSELTTRDTKAAESFYTKLFGWAPKHSAPGADMEYTEFRVGGQPSIGMMPMPPGMPAGVPSYWMPYFQVVDCDGTTAAAKERGASVMVGPRDISHAGRFAILKDPQGAMFALFAVAPVAATS